MLLAQMIKWSFFQNSPVYQHTHTYKHSTLNNIRLKLVYLTRNNLKLFFVLMLLLLFLSFTNNCGKLSFLFVCLSVCVFVFIFKCYTITAAVACGSICFCMFCVFWFSYSSYITLLLFICFLFCFLLCFVYFFCRAKCSGNNF